MTLRKLAREFAGLEDAETVTPKNDRRLTPPMLRELARELADEVANHLVLEDIERVRALAREYLALNEIVRRK